MTEEIIIDGVNVAGCCYYESKNDTGKWCDLTCTRDNAPVFRCENMPNCYYKQLIRLEQENKELKSLNKIICEDCSKEIKVYWNVLEEIKEIAFNGADGNDCTFCNRIFEKIKEALNENTAN